MINLELGEPGLGEANQRKHTEPLGPLGREYMLLARGLGVTSGLLCQGSQTKIEFRLNFQEIWAKLWRDLGCVECQVRGTRKPHNSGLLLWSKSRRKWGQSREFEFLGMLPKQNSPDIYFICQSRALKDIGLVVPHKLLSAGGQDPLVHSECKERTKRS